MLLLAMKYAIKIQLAADDWIFVTEPMGSMFEMYPMLYDTEQEAREAAEIWLKESKSENFVQVVEYDTDREV
jgi:hypothetical protein